MDIRDSYQHLSIHIEGNDDPTVIVFFHGQENEDLYPLLKEESLLLITISGNDWEKDFTPYPHAKVFKGGSDFTGGADTYLQFFLKELIPYLDEKYHLTQVKRVLVGYSLAGLFAFYATTKTDYFVGAGSISGSLWYPGFISYLKSVEVKADNIYLSTGDREAKTKNPYLSQGLTCQFEALDYLNTQGKNCVFDLNPGGHFHQPEARTVKGIQWLIRQK